MLEVMSTPTKAAVSGSVPPVAAPSPAEEHPRSHCLQRSDSLDSIASLVRAGVGQLSRSVTYTDGTMASNLSCGTPCCNSKSADSKCVQICLRLL